MNTIYLHLILVISFASQFCENVLFFDVFKSKVELNGKTCILDDMLFIEENTKSEIGCVARCKFHTGCTSVFYKAAQKRCVLCGVKYQNATGLLDDPGTAYYGDNTFNGTYVFAEKMNYTAAKTYCEEQAGYILQVGSAEENQYIAKRIGNVTGVWLGCTDIQTEGVWIWERPELDTNYSNWKHLAGPLATVARPYENCAALLSHYDYGWGDRDCNRKMTVVCEF